MFWFDHRSKEKFEFNFIGIIGWVIQQNWEINAENSYNDSNYNDQVDIHTTLPIHGRPLWHLESQKVVLGGIEMINWKGILGW